jgi:hypothetical protein
MTPYGDLHEIQALLHAFRDFAECVVTSVLWSHYGTEVTIRIVYVWETDGTVRADDKPARMVDLTCTIVQELMVHSRLSPWITADISKLNWGFGEISLITATPKEDQPDAGDIHVHQFHKMTLWRENGAWIEVVFSKLSMTEFLGPADWSGTNS